ncbi:hypothetical protein BGX21_004018 [Mortierella sp. AD011]|nr:hypothetical protein BGX20_006835 [Mortierella sp. AD010]KAF9374875.1 hypothetical protein BGX21_004018 [Mortierella sp. AD011]
MDLDLLVKVLNKKPIQLVGSVRSWVESEKIKSGVTFADIVTLNIDEPEVLFQIEDLERVEQSVSFATAIADNDLEKKRGISSAKIAADNIDEPEMLASTEDLETKQRTGFAKIVSGNIEKPKVPDPTEDLSLVEVARHIAEE